MAPAIGSISLGLSSASPDLPRHIAKAHLAQHLTEPHLTRHPAKSRGSRTDPASPLAATKRTSLHHTAAAPRAVISVELPFVRAQGLMKGMRTTCLQQPPEAPVSLPTDLTSSQPHQEGPWYQPTLSTPGHKHLGNLMQTAPVLNIARKHCPTASSKTFIFHYLPFKGVGLHSLSKHARQSHATLQT